MFAEKSEALKEEECTVLIYTTFLLFPIHVWLAVFIYIVK